MYTKLLSLMVSKLCHDLLNPVGVVRNSIYMLEEDSLLPEKNSLVTLLKDSNLRSLHLIKCYNLFFGSLLGVKTLNNEDLYRVLSSYLAPITFKWNVHPSLIKTIPKSVAQIIGQGVLLSENLVLKTHQVGFCVVSTDSVHLFNFDFRFSGMDINNRQLAIFNRIIDNFDSLNEQDVNPSTVNMIMFWLALRDCVKNMHVRIIKDNVMNINFDLSLDQAKLDIMHDESCVIKS